MAEVRAEYDAARYRSNRFLRQVSLPVNGASADYHIRNQRWFLTMVELARHFERNEPLIRQAVRRLVCNVNVGGMQLDPDTGDPEVDEHLRSRWQEWSSQPSVCHAAGKLTFEQMADLGLARVVIDGDFFALPLRDGTLQTLEAHRCRTPDRARRDRGVCGVILDNRARPVAYTFTREPVDPNEQVRVADVRRVPAVDADGNRLVFHVYNPERFSQTRGITALAPVTTVLGMRDDLDFAMLVKAQVSACVAFFRERELGSMASSDGSELGEQTSSTWADGTGFTQTSLHPGMILQGEPGEKLSGFSPSIPSEPYFEHVRLLLTYLAVNLDLPLIVLLLDAREANFSSYRNVIDQARATYGKIQSWFASQFHAEVYRWKVRQWLLNDPELQAFARTKSVADLMRHRWNPVGWPYIQPVHDATANLLELANGMTSPRRFAAKRGTDWVVLAREIVEDRAFAIRLAAEAARQLSDELGVDVHWRDLIPTPTAQGIRLALSGDEANPNGVNDAADEMD